jgi:eukaryotic-like serine/threonine-protein kinase
MPVDTFETGSQAYGAYDVVAKIAEGGMGSVYKGRHRLTGELVAIKVLSPQMAKNQVLRRRLEQEYNAAHALNHPNIVRAIDFSDQGTLPFLVMEFVEGESLGQRIEDHGKIEENEAIEIITQVAHGLQKAHREGLIHRDVKPDNVLVTLDGVAKLTDLGLVKELEADLNLTRTGRGLGTPHFTSPEQFRNAKKADFRCDIYSLGATLYMMVTGELPFKGCGPVDCWMKKVNNDLPAPRDLVPILSDRIDWAIRRAMSPEPQQRQASCREFIEDLTGRGTQKLNVTADDEIPTLWFLYYKDDRDVVHTVKGSLAGVRHSLKEWQLGSIHEVRASRNAGGPFEPLKDLPEFRDLVCEAAPLGTGSHPSLPPSVRNTPASEIATASEIGVPPPLMPPTPPPPTRPASKPVQEKPMVELVDRQVADPYETFKWFLLVASALFAGILAYNYMLPLVRSLRYLL